MVRRAVLCGAMTEAAASRVRSAFAQAAARWAVAEISAAIGARAEQAFPVEPVRTLDALHLATALRLREAVPDLAVLTTDERLRVNAAELGFETVPQG